MNSTRREPQGRTIYLDFLKFETLRDCRSYRIYGVRCQGWKRIADYSGTTSSPAERDFAMLNLLICGNLDNRSIRV